MAQQDDQEYFATCAEIERELSNAATDPHVASIHARLAESYERLAKGLIEQADVRSMPAGGLRAQRGRERDLR